MKSLLLFFILLTGSFTATAQINSEDSSVQAIGYWEKNEKQNYTITTHKYRLKGNDTIINSHLTYDVTVSIIDSTEKSFVIEWVYSNYKVSGNELLKQKLELLNQGKKVRFKTDEMGTFEELLNWKEVQGHILKTSTVLQNEFKNDPKFNELMLEVNKVYNSKENIEAIGINEIQQFHTFFGAKYIKGEITRGTIQIPNVLGTKPFDAAVEIFLEEINTKDENYILRFEQSVDKKQLATAVTEYINNLAKKTGKPAPKNLGLDNLVNEVTIGTRMHETGWVIYSIYTKTVITDNMEEVEERIIEIKE
jgi:hypothetical protein